MPPRSRCRDERRAVRARRVRRADAPLRGRRVAERRHVDAAPVVLGSGTRSVGRAGCTSKLDPPLRRLAGSARGRRALRCRGPRRCGPAASAHPGRPAAPARRGGFRRPCLRRRRACPASAPHRGRRARGCEHRAGRHQAQLLGGVAHLTQLAVDALVGAARSSRSSRAVKRLQLRRLDGRRARARRHRPRCASGAASCSASTSSQPVHALGELARLRSDTSWA